MLGVAQVSEAEQSLEDYEEGGGEYEIDTEIDDLENASGATMDETLARAAPSVGETTEPTIAEPSSAKTVGHFARLLALSATYGRKPLSHEELGNVALNILKHFP